MLLGKRIDGLEVRNSTLGSLVPQLTARAYAGTIFMRGNQITDVLPDTFAGTDHNIGRLDLSSNQISRIDFGIFNNFSYLQVFPGFLILCFNYRLSTTRCSTWERIS